MRRTLHACSRISRSRTSSKVGNRSLTSTPLRQSSSTPSCDCQQSEFSEIHNWPTDLPEPIDYHSPLLKISEYATHILINTPSQGAHDWAYKDEPSDSLTSRILIAIQAVRVQSGTPKILVNHVSEKLVAQDTQNSEDVTVQVLPSGHAFKITSPITTCSLDELIKQIVLEPASIIDSLHITTMPIHGPQLFVCGHLSRDARCGLTAPSLLYAAKEVLQQLGSSNNGGQVQYVSHVGGHKFAGNLIMYLPHVMSGSKYGAAWYGRVSLDNIERIIRETIERKLVGENLRLKTGHLANAPVI